jgi:hypothetical protein
LDRKIDPGLFARLMQMSAPERKDLLEYIGQGPMALPPLHDLYPDGAVGPEEQADSDDDKP